MGYKDSDQAWALDDFYFFSTGESVQARTWLRRLKEGSGRPVLTARELAAMAPRPEEAVIVKMVYDRFSPRTTHLGKPMC